MKIAVVSTPVFPVPCSGYAGLEQIAWLCAKGLAEKGHQVKLVAPDGSTCPNVEMVFTGQAGHWNEKHIYLRYRDKITDVDVIIDHGWQKMTYALKMEGRFSGPVLGVLHAPADTMYRSPPPHVAKPCFTCISEDQKSHLTALMNVDARVCYNGVDHEHYHPLDVPRTDRFLFLARFSSIKGADLALEACHRAGVGLDLIGDTSITNEPDYFRQCQAMAERQSPGWDFAKRGKQFRMIGPVSRGEAVWWFSQAHCMIHPNQRFREPLGLAPLEAMLCGCPVIAWKYGAMKETIPPSSSGLPCGLVDSMDDLVQTVRAAYLCDIEPHRREACREWAMQWSVGRMVDRYEELCNEAIATGGW